MYQSSRPRGDSPVSIIGAGIAGAWQALLFAQAGHAVTLYERSDAEMTLSTSHWAGGMLAPWCEAETLEPVIGRLGIRSLDLWREHFPKTSFNGSLVVAHARDRADFERFAKLTEGHVRLDAQGLSDLEPSLDGRFRDGLFYAGEAHVEPRKVLPELHARIEAAGGTIKFDSDMNAEDLDGIVIDCRGLSARDEQPELRGVKGEMIIVETSEVELSRPVRLIHPRWPLYVIPRGENRMFFNISDEVGRLLVMIVPETDQQVDPITYVPSLGREIEKKYGKQALEGLQTIGFKFEEPVG